MWFDEKGCLPRKKKGFYDELVFYQWDLALKLP